MPGVSEPFPCKETTRSLSRVPSNVSTVHTHLIFVSSATDDDDGELVVMDGEISVEDFPRNSN